MLRDADTAMNRAKNRGKARYEIFDEQMHVVALKRLQVETDLRHAMEQHEFEMYYQPIVSLSDEKITGFEALLRWKHGVQGMIPPNEFIPIAEETGIIIPIGEWILHEVCNQISSWLEDGLDNVQVAVNLSARQFQQRDLGFSVLKALKEAGLDSRWLKLELTESALMDNIDGTVNLLKKLDSLGFKISIDDFGTGYSSLAYLKRFPIHTLKIDASFVQGLPGNTEDRAIANAIVAMAHHLNLEVIAEGVETEPQLDFLRELGCERIQGYFYGRPMPASQVPEFLQTWRKKTSCQKES